MTKKHIFKGILILFVCAITSVFCGCVENKLKAAVEESNKSCPISLGISGELTSFSYKDNSVQILYTLDEQFADIDALAANPEGKSGMKIWLVVLFGTLGALLGALINYFLSRWLGRPIIYAFVDSKWGHMLQLSGEKMERAEKYFNEHGVVSTLVGRLIPVIRQLISIPAGLSKMNIWAFMLYTTLGALVWNCVLALLGWLAYQAADPSVIERYSSLLSYVIIGVFVVAVGYFAVRYLLKKRRHE